jgi:hypothetical protein
MAATVRQTLASVMAEILKPHQLARYERYRAELRAQADQHGELFAEVWSAAQTYLASRGRVKPPPSGWDFVPIVQDLPFGVSPEFSPVQRTHWREFWEWYLPVERGIGRMIWIIEVLHKLGPQHYKLKNDVCQVAYVVKTQYQRWMQDGDVPWLPKGRGAGKPETIVQLLEQVLVRLDRGPAKDDGDPGPEWEPMP